MTQVKVEGATLTLNMETWQWAGTGEDADVLATMANVASLGYRYGPADGEPGSLLASRVAERLGGRAVLPPPSPLPEVVPPGVDAPSPAPLA